MRVIPFAGSPQRKLLLRFISQEHFHLRGKHSSWPTPSAAVNVSSLSLVLAARRSILLEPNREQNPGHESYARGKGEHMRAFSGILTVLLTVLVLVLYAGVVWAQQGLPVDTTQVPVEYSNLFDERALGCVHDGIEPQQVLYTEPLDLPGCPFVANGFDFAVLGLELVDVDALANCQDHYFDAVLSNISDLLLSFAGDAPDPPGKAVYYEKPAGTVGVLWSQMNLCNNGGGVDGSVEDVDALELWGQLSDNDANMFSLDGEPGGVSVWSYLGSSPVARPYIWQTTIWGAAQTLGFLGNPTDADVDAMMVFDAACDTAFSDTGDMIIFSIKAAANWDGGEIVVLPMGGPPFFLNHGGHLWDTAHAIAADFLVGTDEVDAIESAANVDILPMQEKIPTVSEWGMIVLILLMVSFGVMLIVRRRLHPERSS